MVLLRRFKMKIERLRKLAKNIADKDNTASLKEKGVTLDTASEDDLMGVIVYYVIDEIECGNWETYDDIFDVLGASEKETEEIMAELPEYFGEDEDEGF